MPNGQILKHFSPAWFATVMGTGGLANVLYLLKDNSPLLHGAAVSLWWLNVVLFLILVGPWIVRWLFHYQHAFTDLNHPLLSNFFITMPAGCIILGTNFFLIGRPYLSAGFLVGLGVVLWLSGAVLAFVFGVYGMYNLMRMEAVGPEPISFAWLMMPVVNIVVPLLGNPLVAALAPGGRTKAVLINLVDVVFYGIGLLLFLTMLPIVTNRLIKHKMPPAAVAPTFWILLGPVGVGTVALLGLADVSKMLGLLVDGEAVKFLALIFWGFGLWAFALTAVVTMHYVRSGGVPFTLSWWAFIFPLAAYTLATLEVFRYTGVAAVYWYGVALAVLLALLWAATFGRTVAGVFSGRLLLPPSPSPTLPKQGK